MKQFIRGSILRTVLIVIAIILVISYFGFDLRGVAESEQSQRNFGYVKEQVVHVWEKYLERPAKYLWNDIFIELIWDTAVENLERIQDGKPSTIEDDGPALPPAPRI
jgi:hypothetical protein